MPLKVNEEKAQNAVNELKKLQGKYNPKRKKELTLILFEACNWDRNEVRKKTLPIELIKKVTRVNDRPINATELTEKVLNNLLENAVKNNSNPVYKEIRKGILFANHFRASISRSKLNKSINQKRNELIINYAKQNNKINSFVTLARELGISQRTISGKKYSSIFNELNKVFLQKTGKKFYSAGNKTKIRRKPLKKIQL